MKIMISVIILFAIFIFSLTSDIIIP